MGRLVVREGVSVASRGHVLGFGWTMVPPDAGEVNFATCPLVLTV